MAESCAGCALLHAHGPAASFDSLVSSQSLWMTWHRAVLAVLRCTRMGLHAPFSSAACRMIEVNGYKPLMAVLCCTRMGLHATSISAACHVGLDDMAQIFAGCALLNGHGPAGHIQLSMPCRSL